MGGCRRKRILIAEKWTTRLSHFKTSGCFILNLSPLNHRIRQLGTTWIHLAKWFTCWCHGWEDRSLHGFTHNTGSSTPRNSRLNLYLFQRSPRLYPATLSGILCQAPSQYLDSPLDPDSAGMGWGCGIRTFKSFPASPALRTSYTLKNLEEHGLCTGILGLGHFSFTEKTGSSKSLHSCPIT